MAKGKLVTPKKLIKSASIILVSCIVLLMFFFLYRGSTKPILQIADKFQPDPSWTLVSERVMPPKFFCVDVKCPSVHRVWKTDEPLTRDDLESLVVKSGLGLEIEGDCIPKQNALSGSFACKASGLVEDKIVEVSVNATYYDKKDNQAILSVD